MTNLLKPEIDPSTLASWEDALPHDTVLSRKSSSDFSPVGAHGLKPVTGRAPGQTSAQIQIDSLVSGFIHQASDWKSLAAMTAGGLAYRWGKISVLSVGAIRESPLLARPISIAFGLGSEVTAFEFTHRTLHTFAGGETPPLHTSNDNLWSWSGPGGWKEGLLTSFVTFGTLKGFGQLSQGQNLILQHGLQDAGMVLGHQLVSRTGIGAKPEGTLAEQFVHAEATNIQIGAGMGLGHGMTGRKILAMERGLDLSLQSKSPPTSLLRLGSGQVFQRGVRGDFALATAEESTRQKFPQPTRPLLAEMNGDGGSGTSKALIVRSQNQELTLNRVKGMELKIRNDSDENCRKALMALKALLPELAETDRTQLALRVIRREDGISMRFRNEVNQFVIAIGKTLSPPQRLILLKGLEEGLKNPYGSGLPAVEIVGELIPLLESADRLYWTRIFIEKMEAYSSPAQSGLISTFGSLAALLPEGDRFILAQEMVKRLKDMKFSAGFNLGTLFPHLSEAQKLDLTLNLEGYLESEHASARRAAVDKLSGLIPKLDPAVRSARREKIEEFLNDPDYLVRRSAVEALVGTLKSFDPPDRLVPILKIVDRLLTHPEKERDLYIQKVELNLKDLSPEQWQALADRTEEALSDDDWNFRRTALEIFEKLTPYLSPEYLRTLIPKIEARMIDEEHFVRPSAVNALRQVARFLPEGERFPLSLKIGERWINDFKHLSYSGNEALQWLAAILPEGDRLTLVRKMESHLSHEDKKIGEGALDFLKSALRYLNARQRLPILLRFEEKLKDEDPDIQKTALRTLQEYLPTMGASSRIEFLIEMLRREGLPSLNLEFLPLLLHRLPAEAIGKYAEKYQNPNLGVVAHYHGSRLPYHKILWQDYLKAKDRDDFLRDTGVEVRRHRQGKAIYLSKGNEAFLAYLGLDAPEGLSFEAFQKELGTKTPPPPFLNRPFRALVVEKKSSFQMIDKGKVTEALTPFKELRTSYHLEMLIRNLLKSEEAPLKGLREKISELETLLKGHPLKMDSIVGEIKKLLPRIWDFRKNPKAQELLLKLVLFLTWHSPGLEAQREKIEKIHQDHKIPSDVYLMGVKTLEELYRDSVDEALSELGLWGEDIPFIRKQRRLLRAELERAQDETGEEALVEFIPSKTPADRFFGYVGEDCTKPKGESIYRDDFQIYRMISKDRLVGMLYLQKKKIGWWSKALVIAIQPRSFWEVDQPTLLRAVEEQLSLVARAEGYDYVLLMNNRNQQSNRQDMLAAILREHYPLLVMKKPIGGAVFSGSEFLVMWQKGQVIRSAPPIEISPPTPMEEIQEEPLEEEENIPDANLLPPPPETLSLEPIPEEEPFPAEEGIEVIPANALPSFLRAAQTPPSRPLRLLLEDRADPQTLRSFQHLLQNMMAENTRNLPVRQKRRMMQAMNAEFLAEVRRAFEEAEVPLPYGMPGPGGGVGYGDWTQPDNKLMRIPPAHLVKYQTLIIKKDELLPPGTLVLRRRPLESILSDPRITRTDMGWFEPTLKGRIHGVEHGEVVGSEVRQEMALTRGDEITVQDLFDFYNVIFYQGYQLRGYLRLLQNRGADIQPLAEVVEGLSQQLDKGLEHLFARRFDEALELLQMADIEVTEFQKTMRKIAHTVGLEIDPKTGTIYPRGR